MGIAAGGGFMLLVILLILIICRRQSHKAERNYRKMQLLLDNLESNVRNECKQGKIMGVGGGGWWVDSDYFSGSTVRLREQKDAVVYNLEGVRIAQSIVRLSQRLATYLCLAGSNRTADKRKN